MNKIKLVLLSGIILIGGISIYEASSLYASSQDIKTVEQHKILNKPEEVSTENAIKYDDPKVKGTDVISKDNNKEENKTDSVTNKPAEKDKTLLDVKKEDTNKEDIKENKNIVPDKDTKDNNTSHVVMKSSSISITKDDNQQKINKTEEKHEVLIPHETKQNKVIKQPKPHIEEHKSKPVMHTLTVSYINNDIAVWGIPTDTLISGNDTIREKALELTNGKDSNIEKAKAIYRYVRNNVNYSDDVLSRAQSGGCTANDISAIGVFNSGETICCGYASLYFRMMLDAGVPVKYINGEVKDIGSGWAPHAWNEVLINGSWMFVDCSSGEFGHTGAGQEIRCNNVVAEAN